jgi:hypothetical protein
MRGAQNVVNWQSRIALPSFVGCNARIASTGPCPRRDLYSARSFRLRQGVEVAILVGRTRSTPLHAPRLDAVFGAKPVIITRNGCDRTVTRAVPPLHDFRPRLALEWGSKHSLLACRIPIFVSRKTSVRSFCPHSRHISALVCGL